MIQIVATHRKEQLNDTHLQLAMQVRERTETRKRENGNKEESKGGRERYVLALPYVREGRLLVVAGFLVESLLTCVCLLVAAL